MAEKKTSWLDQQFGGKIFVYPLVPSLFAFILAIVSSFIVNFSDIRFAPFSNILPRFSAPFCISLLACASCLLCLAYSLCACLGQRLLHRAEGLCVRIHRHIIWLHLLLRIHSCWPRVQGAVDPDHDLGFPLGYCSGMAHFRNSRCRERCYDPLRSSFCFFFRIISFRFVCCRKRKRCGSILSPSSSSSGH